MGKALEEAIHGSALGAIIGVLQWLALRAPGPRSAVVGPRQDGGWSIGAATGDAIGYFTGGPFDLITGIVVAAAVTGAGLIMVLRPRGQVPFSTGGPATNRERGTGVNSIVNSPVSAPRNPDRLGKGTDGGTHLFVPPRLFGH
ncbi:MAG: hypothetical protein ACRDHS_14590 [Actinomycetota bacterium]